MTAVQDPLVVRRQLGRDLSELRFMKGLSREDVAHTLGWEPSKLRQLEQGDRRPPQINDLNELLTLYGVNEQRRVEVLDRAKRAGEESFYAQYVDVLRPGFLNYLIYEPSASVIRHYERMLTPGLLQDEEYGRTILKQVNEFSEDQVDRAWAVHQHRQEVHRQQSPPQMNFIVDEAVLRRQVDQRHVMNAQLRQLRGLVELPHICLQIMTFADGAHAGMNESFILLEFEDLSLDDLLYLDCLEGRTTRDTDLIADRSDRFEQLQRQARPQEESVILLDKLISETAASPPT